MSRYRIYIIFSVVVALGLAAIFFVYRGYYPIVVVDGSFISAKRFAMEYSATLVYYENLLKTYEPTFRDSERLTPEDLQLAVINGIVEKVLVSRGAKAESGEDFEYLIQNKLDKFSGELEVEKIAGSLYGLSADEFEDSVLIPYAEREILAGRLFLRGEKIEDWLRDIRAAASVIIFSPRFEWNGQEVVDK